MGSENGTTQLAHLGPCFHRKGGTGCCICASEPGTDSTDGGALPMNKQANPVIPCEAVEHVSASAVNAEHGVPAIQSVCSPCAAVPELLMVGVSAAPLPPNGGCPPTLILPGPGMIPQVPDWRCIHGNIVVPPAAPEMVATGGHGRGTCIQWPAVIHATAYVVELFEQGTVASQCFTRAVPPGIMTALVDLHVDNLQPSAYASRVRCAAPCGCESMSSAWSFLPAVALPPLEVLQMTPAWQMLPPAAAPAMQAVVPQSCPPPPSMPPSLPTSTVAARMALPTVPEETADDHDEEMLLLD